VSILEVTKLKKKYPSFELGEISFSLEEGKITGFIGRNGAGKSTTLKALFNYVHPDSGEIAFLGKRFLEHELEIKQDVGLVFGGINYYSKKKIKTITSINKLFFKDWDDNAYREYMKLFCLDENKTPSELSEGMKVKFALVLALSHNAKLLILDEPTSGLDPVSRDELLDVFNNLCEKGITILFSTHITSDLEKCADNIIYIKNGKILENGNMKEFVTSYKILNLKEEQITEEIKPYLIGCKRAKEGYTALIKEEYTKNINIPAMEADLEAIMIHMEKEEM